MIARDEHEGVVGERRHDAAHDPIRQPIGLDHGSRSSSPGGGAPSSP
jgi:hypothetical protein